MSEPSGPAPPGDDLPPPRSGLSVALIALFALAILALAVVRWTSMIPGLQCAGPGHGASAPADSARGDSLR